MNRINGTQSIGDIVAIMPQASKIFMEYNIDFCCGGNRPLEEAISQQNINKLEILSRLNQAFYKSIKSKSKEADFTQVLSGMLIDHIIDVHHTYVKEVLPQISSLAGKILKVHGENHEVLLTVHNLFHNLKAELEQHLVKEEEILFPLIKENERNPSPRTKEKIKKAIKDLEGEHETAGVVLKELRLITGGYKVPQDGCTTYVLTFEKLKELEADLFQHIHLENNILFKRDL